MSAQQIHNRFIENGWTLSLAESCTGGGIASSLVAIPDCSIYFVGGVVAYSNRIKEKILGVKPSTLKTVVSEQTALEMAAGVREKFESDFALATTGVTGSKGEVCFAIVAHDREPLTWTTHYEGERGAIIEQAITDALGHLCTFAV